MLGVIVLLLALLISGRRPKDNEDLFVSFVLVVFSIMFVIFSPLIATIAVSETNIFSVTKQYNETYYIVKLQDGTYYKTEKKENGWHVTINQCDDATNTYASMEYDTGNIWYGTTNDLPYVELNYFHAGRLQYSRFCKISASEWTSHGRGWMV